MLRPLVYFFLYFYFLSTFSRKVQILTLAFLQLVACTDRFNLIILKQFILIYAVYSRCMLLLSSLTICCLLPNRLSALISPDLPLCFHFAELFYVLKSIKHMIFPTRQKYLICVLCLFQRFVIEVKTKGGSKYFIYRRYREFFTLHQTLESKYSPEESDRQGQNTCPLPPLPGETVSRFTLLEYASVRGFQVHSW